MVAELKSMTRTRLVSFWGHRYRVTPRLVHEKLGDGKKLVWIEPLATRPDYYLIFVDSKWSVDNCNPNPLCDHLEEVYQAIEGQFGYETESYEHENGRTYKKHNPFPALHLSCGCCWGEFKEGM